MSADAELPDTVTSLADVAYKARIIDVLRAAHGNKSEAAQLLGISRGTLYRRLQAYGLHHLVRNPLDGLEAEQTEPRSA